VYAVKSVIRRRRSTLISGSSRPNREEMDNDGKPQPEDDGDEFLKRVPEGFTPAVENESDAFRSLDLSDSDEEDDGFLRKGATEIARQFVPEVENESHAFRSLGSRSEFDEDEVEKEEVKEKIEKPPPVDQPLINRPLASSPISETTSSGISFVECGCCEHCPYHVAVEKAEVESGTSNTKSRGSSKKSGTSKESSKQDRRRAKSIESAEEVVKAKNGRARASQSLSRLFARLLPPNNDEALAYVCSGFTNALLQSNALVSEDDDDALGTESEE